MTTNNWTKSDLERLNEFAIQYGYELGRASEKYKNHWKKLDRQGFAMAAVVTVLVELAGGRNKASKLMGVGPTTLDNYRKGETQPKYLELTGLSSKVGISLEVVAEALNISEFRAMKSKQNIGSHSPSTDNISIPRYEIQAAAGDGNDALSQDVTDYFMVSKDWVNRFVPKGANLGMVEARGDSMETTIRDGEALIINFNISKTDVARGGVFVFSDSQGVKVKRFQDMIDGRLRISSDNDRYEPEYVDKEFADEHLTIHAEVLFGIGPLRSA